MNIHASEAVELSTSSAEPTTRVESITGWAPTRSRRRPAPSDIRPPARVATANAPEIDAFDQPVSSRIGETNAPNP